MKTKMKHALLLLILCSVVLSQLAYSQEAREGVIGLQIHDGAIMKVEYRNLYVLPIEGR